MYDLSFPIIRGYGAQDRLASIQLFAADCDVIIHKNCAPLLMDSCYPATQSKAKETKIRPRKSKEEEADKVGEYHITVIK